MKTYWASLFAFCCMAPIFAQGSFQKNLDVFLDAPLIGVAPDGKSFYAAAVAVRNGLARIHVYKLDELGNPTWHQEQFSNDVNLTLKTIEATSDGLVLLFSSYVSEKQSNGYLIKFNADGTVAWDRQIGAKNFTQLFEIQLDNKENLWLSGLHLAAAQSDSFYYFLALLDKNGQVLESRQNYFRYFPHTGYETCRYSDLTWNHHNNSLIYVEDFEGSHTQSAIIAFNRGRFALGYCEMPFDFDESLLAIQLSKLENAGQNLFFSGWTTKDNFQKEQPAIGILNKTGKATIVTKITPSLFVPIHSHTNDLVFYVPQDKTLVKFDADLNPVWTIKLDNCTATTAFAADIAPDGCIYTIRNINNKTIVAKVLPDGGLAACTPYPKLSPTLNPHTPIDVSDYSPGGYPAITVTDTLHQFGFVTKNSITTDYCVKMDASFELPGIICVGVPIKPSQVDTTANLRHTWDSADFRVEDSIPIFSFQSTGLKKVLHRVENAVCQDTATRYTRIIPRPELLVGDTLVCGPSSFRLDLQHPAATRYFLNGQPTPPKLNIDRTGMFTLRVENGACSEEKTIQVKIVAFDPPVLPIDSSFCPDIPVKIALPSEFDAVFWDQKQVLDTFIILDGAPHHYQARYKPEPDCVVSGEFTISRKDCGAAETPFFAPNVFAPNTANGNAVFQVFPKPDILLRSMRIFDRWGTLVYQSSDAQLLWDGTAKGREAGVGIYTYLVEYEDISANTLKITSGEVMLFR